MDSILGEEIMRIADDEPRYLFRAGNTLNDKTLNLLLKLSRYQIAIDKPEDLWGFNDDRGKVNIKNSRLERSN